MAIQVGTLIDIAGKLIAVGAAAKELKDQFEDDFGKAEVEVSATLEEIAIIWRGTAFDSNHTADFSGVTNVVETAANGNTITKQAWRWRLRVFEDAGNFVDGLTFSGSVRHLWQLHDSDEQTTNSLEFETIVNADNTKRQTVPGSTDTYNLVLRGDDIATNAKHPGEHYDTIVEQEFRGTIEGSWSNDDFTGYTYKIKVRHVTELSEPDSDNEGGD